MATDADLRWHRAEDIDACAGVKAREEFGKGGLRIKPRREQQGARAIVLTAELRIGTALLEENGHYLEGISSPHGTPAEGAAGRRNRT